MYQISDNLKQILKQPSRIINVRATANNLPITSAQISQFTIEDSLDNEIPCLASVGARKLSITLINKDLPVLYGKCPIKLEIGICNQAGVSNPEDATTFDWIPMGIYYIDKIEKKKIAVEITAYDCLYGLSNLIYTSALEYPASMADVAQEIEEKYDVEFENVPTGTMPDEVGANVRETIASMALYTGTNARVTRTGKIEFFKPSKTSCFSVDGSNYESISLLGEDVQEITMLTATDSEGKTIKVGTGTGATYSINSDYVKTTEALTSIYNLAEFPISYQAYNLSAQGWPHLDIGDQITLTDTNGEAHDIPIASHTLSFSGGLRSVLKAGTVQNEEVKAGSGVGSVTQTIRTLTADLTYTNRVLADKADITSLNAQSAKIATLETEYADISTLVAEKASISDLNAQVARIDTIESDYISTDNLEAIEATIEEAVIEDLSATMITTDNLNAKLVETDKIKAMDGSIQNLQSSSADINTLVTGNATITSASVIALTALNTSIENALIKSAMIDSISADKLTSGTIYTNLIDIQGPNGNFHIKDNTLQIKDTEGNVRIQMGLYTDEEETTAQVYDFSIFDAEGKVLFDALGLGENTVRDINVDSDANISASKLNIESLFKAINEDESYTINTGKIYFDEQQASLDIFLQTLNSNMTTLTNDVRITSEGITEALTLSEEAKTATANLSSTVDGLEARYTTTEQGLEAITKTTSSFFREDANGTFIIGKSEQGTSNYAQMQLDTDQVKFVNQEGETTAYFGNLGFGTTKGIVTTGNLQIGNFAFVIRDNGSLDFKKVTGDE